MTSLVQQLVNLDAAIALVEKTPARMINLNRWSSTSWWRFGEYPTERQVRSHAFGVQVCLGGLIACDPYFQSLGVTRTKDGVPSMAMPAQYGYGLITLHGLEVSNHLFGASHLFFSGWMDLETPHKEIALRRLRERRAQVLYTMEFEARSKHDAKCAATPRRLTDPVL